MFRWLRELISAPIERDRWREECNLTCTTLENCRIERETARTLYARASVEAEDWRRRYDELLAKYESANTDGNRAREALADFFAQKYLGRKMFEHVPHLPEKEPDKMPEFKPSRMQARARIQQMEREFDEKIRQIYNQQPGQRRQQPVAQPPEPTSAPMTPEENGIGVAGI